MLANVSASTFTRPSDTTAYAAGDLIANSTTAGSVVPLSFRIPGSGKAVTVKNARIRKSAASVTNFATLLYLFDSAPTVAAGDNSAPAPSVANLLGVVSLASTGAIAGTSVGYATAETTLTIPMTTSRTIYGLLVANAAYTPASEETFTVSLTVDVTK